MLHSILKSQGIEATLKMWLFLVCIIGFIGISNGQSRKSLEQQRENILSEISSVNKRLASYSADKKSQSSAIRLLDQKIKFRKQLAQNFESELNVLHAEIGENSKEIKSLEKELSILKEGYAQMLLSTQKQMKTSNNWWFILSSENMGQAYKRYYYLKQYSNYRHLQSQEIAEKKDALEKVKMGLVTRKKEKEKLKSKKLREKKILEKEQSDFKNRLKKLQGKESELRKELAAKEKRAQYLKKAIKEAIAKERAASAKKKEDSGGSKAYVLTPEEAILSKEFKGNMGKLPWPVKSGKIINHFGKHRHPYLPNITMENDGIEIETSKGQNVRAVFKGTVSSVIILPTGLKVVILKHGDYSSIYSNLSEVNVKIGEEVDIKDKLGKVHISSGEVGKLEFQIWRGNNGQNPEDWLSK